MKSLNEWNRVTFVLARYSEYLNIGGNEIGGFGNEWASNPGAFCFFYDVKVWIIGKYFCLADYRC